MQGHLGIAIAQTHASGVFPTPDRPIKNKPFVLNVFHQGMNGRSHMLTESLGRANRFCCCNPALSFLECDRVFCHRKLATRTCCEKSRIKKLAKLTWCAPFKTLPKHSLCSEECVSAIGESCAPKQNLKNYKRSKNKSLIQSRHLVVDLVRQPFRRN